MSTKRAVYEVTEFKSLDPEGAAPTGDFKAVVSVFNNVDLQGDRVMPGAFKSWLERAKRAGDPIPVVWSHQWDNPAAHIGFVDPAKASETPGGLEMAGKIDLDNPFAKQVHRLMTERRVKGWSFAYDVHNERRAKDGANELLELAIIEVGPTLKGANPEAQLISAKALDEALEQFKAGRQFSSANQAALQKIVDGLSSLQDELITLLGLQDNTDNANADGTAKADDADGAKDAEPHAFSADTQYPNRCSVCGAGADRSWHTSDEDKSDEKADEIEHVKADDFAEAIDGAGMHEPESLGDFLRAINDLSYDPPDGEQGDPLAVMIVGSRTEEKLRELGDHVKAAIAPHKTATDDGSWDGPANERRVTSPNDSGKSYFARIFAWSKSDGDPTVKASYKFIHHEVSGDGSPGAANIKACQTGIGVLNGGMGGTVIPSADLKGVYAHLAAHLRDAGVEPPPLKHIEPEATKTANGDGEEPAAKRKSTVDPEALQIRFRIEEMRRT